MEEALAFLSKTPLFAGIESSELSGLLRCLDAGTKNYKQGELLLITGEPVNKFGLILTGQVHVEREEFSGSRSILTYLTQGEMFGEVFVCAGVHESPVTVSAASDCAVLWMNYRQIMTFCSRNCSCHTQLIQNLLHIIAQKTMYLNRKLSFLSRRTIREKIAAFLLDKMRMSGSKKFKIEYSRYELADYLSVDRSALSRELGALRDEGILNFKRSEFEILKPEELDI